MEETEERVPKTVPNMLTRTSTASLFLTRLKAKRSSSKQDELESGRVQYEPSLPDDSISPSMEDYFIISEHTTSDEIDRTSLRINEDLIKNILTEHKRHMGYKSQILENLESGKMDEINVNTTFADIKSNEVDILLLQASFLGRINLIHHLCKCGANINYTEPNHGLTPLHLCAFRNCLDGVKYLIEQGASIDTKSKHTAFHYAAFGDAFDVAQYFMQRGISQLSPYEAEETVLHVASRTDALRVLSLLAPNNKELNRLDQDGYAAIHHAANSGDKVCLDILLKAGCQVDLFTRKNDTALHLAAEVGCVSNLILLVKANANLQLKNHRGYTALHLAARSHSLECVEILLKGRANPNVEDNEGRTPLHLALGKSLMTDDITELLLKWRADVNKADKYGYTPLHIAASNELSRCVNLLIKHEANLSARTIGGNSALSIVLRKTPTSLDMFERRLDKSLTLSRQGFIAGKLELQLDFRPLLQHRRNRSSETGYLNTFVKEGYKEILEHPLCQSFLHLKWHKIRKYYIARLLFYLIYVLILTSWVIAALAHNCYNESKGYYMHNKPLCSSATGIYGFFYRHPTLLEIHWYALMMFTILEACRKFAVICSYRSVRQFFTQVENLVDWCVILSVFATSFVYTGKTYVWQRHLGAFAVLCGWSNLMLMIGQLPVFGAYVAMFTSVQAQVFKLLLAYACLLVGFTASFCVIFPYSNSFSSPHIGLIKVLAMMTGDLGFDSYLISSDKSGIYENNEGASWILLQISAQLFFVLFLLFVTIVLMNLLIGIAVHDIKGLQKTAGLAKLVRQTKLIHDVETAIFLGFMPSKRFIKCMRWTTLLLPPPLRAVLTVRPLNPREKRLPRDVLSAAYKIAKERDGQNNYTASRRKIYSAKAGFKGDMTMYRRRGFDEDTLQHDCDKFKDEIAELKEICEKNHTLLQELIKAHKIRLAPLLVNSSPHTNGRGICRVRHAVRVVRSYKLVKLAVMLAELSIVHCEINMYENDRDSLGESAKVKNLEMNNLETPIILNDEEHFYSKSFNSCHKSDPLSVRSTPIYRSLRCAYAEDYPQKIVIDDATIFDNDQIEIDAGVPPPVDDSLFFDNLEILECHKNHYVNGAKLRSAIWSIVDTMETRLLQYMEKSRTLPNACKSENLRNIAYIWASYRGLLHLLPELEDAGARYDYVEPRTGVNAILAASLGDKVACVEYLIAKGANVNYESPIIHYTPLHFAALGNSWHAAATLLDHGAKLNYVCQEVIEPILHSAIRAKAVETVKLLLERGASVVEKNHLGQTPLHVACFVQSIPCVELLSASAPNVNAVDREHRTPLHFAVMSTDSSAELVQLLLKRGALINAADRTGFTPLHIAALNEQSQCVDALIWAGADISATTCTGLSALNIILKKIPESLHVFRQRLDASIRLTRPVSHNREFEMRLHFDILFPSGNQCETSFINTFVQERRKDLLSHPLVMAFLHLKWEKIRKLYLLRILLYSMTVICLTTYVLTALAYKCYNQNETNSSKICGSRRPSDFFFRKSIIEIEWYLALVLTCITIPRKIYGFMVYKSALQYFSSIDNVLDGVVIVSVFVTSFVYTGRTYDWQNYVGAFAVLCAWTNLMLMVGQLPAFGTYVAMFTHIQFEFAKLLLAYSGLLIGFTISFCVIFASEPAFGNPFTGLIKVLAMMVGELDFEGFINQMDDKPMGGSFVIYHPILSVCSQILFTLFIVFVTVILMNLLVGIAVHDIQGLRNHAGLTKLVRQTKMILFTEMVLHNTAIPYAFRKWMSDHKIDVENRKRVLVVKPLNPLEKRLPKDIMKAAYEIAQKNIPSFMNDDINLSDRAVWLKQRHNGFSDGALEMTFEKLIAMMKVNEDAIKLLRVQLLEMNKMLENVATKLTKEEHTTSL
ncbi:PYX protein, partial [Acromyrmex charruanus]